MINIHEILQSIRRKKERDAGLDCSIRISILIHPPTPSTTFEEISDWKKKWMIKMCHKSVEILLFWKTNESTKLLQILTTSRPSFFPFFECIAKFHVCSPSKNTEMNNLETPPPCKRFEARITFSVMKWPKKFRCHLKNDQPTNDRQQHSDIEIN